MNDKKLNLRQERFCLEYVNTCNGTQSAITAGYSRKTAEVIASENLTKPKIALRIQELIKETHTDRVSSAIERKETLTEIHRGRFGQFADEEGHLDIPNREALNSAALQEVKTNQVTIGGRGDKAAITETTTTIKLRDPIDAIRELNRMEKIYDAREAPSQLIQTFVFVLPDGTKVLPGQLRPKEPIDGQSEEVKQVSPPAENNPAP